MVLTTQPSSAYMGISFTDLHVKVERQCGYRHTAKTDKKGCGVICEYKETEHT